MNNSVKVLDCTLRDGGYINNWNFGTKEINGIINNLVKSKVDIIECGFIRDVDYQTGSSVFTSMEQVEKFIQPKNPEILYAIMIEQHNYDPTLISLNAGKSVDIVRLTFRKKEWKEAKKTAIELRDKGYKVCIQPVGTATYDDKSLLNLIKDVNEINPFAFYLVDTLGTMYRHDMHKFFCLIDNNLNKDIMLGYHSHNNLQMSFSNAQEMMRLNKQRTIILDSSCYGMGRGVGNLATELIMDYINHNVCQRYLLSPILDIVDKYLMSIYAEQRWGYDLPYFLSATANCHPNYATYLMGKETLSIERIEKLLSLIPIDSRSEYNATLIEQLYINMQTYDIADSDALKSLESAIGSKSVLIVGSGISIETQKKDVDNIVSKYNPYIITTNFITDTLVADALFVSNEKRIASLNLDNINTILVTSNLQNKVENNVLLFNYSSLLGEGDASDNAGAMLIRLLKKVNVKKIFLAGFDGFEVDSSENYYVADYKKALDFNTVQKKNKDISKQLKSALSGIDYEIITKTKYEI